MEGRLRDDGKPEATFPSFQEIVEDCTLAVGDCNSFFLFFQKNTQTVGCAAISFAVVISLT